MKYLLLLYISFITSVQCQAQAIYVPNTRAVLINDDAIHLYLKFRNEPDSIRSAIQMLNNAVTIDYNYYFAWANKLSFECKLKEYDSALNTSQRMARIFSDNIDLVFFSGLLEFKTGHNTEAIAIFNGLIKQYSKLHDNNDNSDHIKTALLNKAIALKLLDKAAESKKILTDLSNKEKDPAVKKHINSYITKTKEKIINDMIDEK